MRHECANCGRKIGTTWLAIADYCPTCKESPFREKAVQDPEHVYFVPVDPADETNCEACQ